MSGVPLVTIPSSQSYGGEKEKERVGVREEKEIPSTNDTDGTGQAKLENFDGTMSFASPNKIVTSKR